MKQIEQAFNINLFDRFNLAYREGNEVLSLPRNAFEDKIKAGEINAETIVFNNLVPNLKDLQTQWEVPFRNSWHMQLFGSLVSA